MLDPPEVAIYSPLIFKSIVQVETHVGKPVVPLCLTANPRGQHGVNLKLYLLFYFYSMEKLHSSFNISNYMIRVVLLVK